MITEASIELCPEFYSFSYLTEDKETSNKCIEYSENDLCIGYSNISDGIEKGCIVNVVLTGVVYIICYPFLWLVK